MTKHTFLGIFCLVVLSGGGSPVWGQVALSDPIVSESVRLPELKFELENRETSILKKPLETKLHTTEILEPSRGDRLYWQTFHYQTESKWEWTGIIPLHRESGEFLEVPFKIQLQKRWKSRSQWSHRVRVHYEGSRYGGTDEASPYDIRTKYDVSKRLVSPNALFSQGIRLLGEAEAQYTQHAEVDPAHHISLAAGVEISTPSENFSLFGMLERFRHYDPHFCGAVACSEQDSTIEMTRVKAGVVYHPWDLAFEIPIPLYEPEKPKTIPLTKWEIQNYERH